MIDGLAFGFHKLGEPYTLKHARAVAGSIPLIGNAGFVFLALAFVFWSDLILSLLFRYTAETAEAALAVGQAEVIAFGRPYLSAPDFPERVANDWPQPRPLAHKYYYTPFPNGEGYIMPKYSASA